MTRSTRDRVLLGIVLCLAIYFGAADLVPDSGIGSILHPVLGHPVLLLWVGGGLGLVLLLVRRGRLRQAGLAASVAGAALAAYGFRRVRIVYPHNLLLSAAGYAKAAKVLLGQDILLEDYQPKPALVVANPPVFRAKDPAIDVDFHLASLDPGITPERLVAAMDSVGIASLVNLDLSPENRDRFLRAFVRRYPDRFINFAMLPLWKVDEADFVEAERSWLGKAILLGARGIEVPKLLGPSYRDSTGTLIPMDDPRLDFVWDLAGELGLPVVLHIGDPAAFFQPIDRFNERYEELQSHRYWSDYGTGSPPRDSLLAESERLLGKHPHTVFIGAHLGNSAGDLRYAAHLLDTYPNYYVDISLALNELGRQPRAARAFFIRYQGRILFGTGGGPDLGSPDWSIEKFYRTHFQLLETDAEYFDYPLAEITRQGRWKIYGLSLPDSVLAEVYAGNVRKLIPSEADVLARLHSLRKRRAPAELSPEAACTGRPYWWARSNGERPTPLGDDSAEVARADFAGDRVRVTNYSFRPGHYREILSSGLVRNGTGSTIELRGYRVEYLSTAGKVIAAARCRVRAGYENCGLTDGSNIRLPGYVALSVDTLPLAPAEARLDTARVFWSYCFRP